MGPKAKKVTGPIIQKAAGAIKAAAKKAKIQKAGEQIIRRAARRGELGISTKFIRQKTGLNENAAKALAKAINDDGKVDDNELQRIRNRFGEKAHVARLAQFIGAKPLKRYQAYRKKSVKEAGGEIMDRAYGKGGVSAEMIYPYVKWGAAVAIAKAVKNDRLDAAELRVLKRFGSRALALAKFIVEQYQLSAFVSKAMPGAVKLYFERQNMPPVIREYLDRSVYKVR